MKRSFLENLYFKKRTDHSLKNYKNKNTIAADYTKKREKTSLISQLYFFCAR